MKSLESLLNKAKPWAAGAAIALASLTANNAQAQTHSQAEHKEHIHHQLGVERGSHPVQPFDIYLAGADTLKAGELRVPRGEQQLAKSYFNEEQKRFSPQFALPINNENDVFDINRNEYDIILVPQQTGDQVVGENIQEKIFLGKTAYQLQPNDKLVTEFFIQNDCESEKAAVLTYALDQQEPVVQQPRPQQPIQAQQPVRQQPAPQESASPNNWSAQANIGYLTMDGDIQQMAGNRHVTIPIEATGQTISASLEHNSDAMHGYAAITHLQDGRQNDLYETPLKQDLTMRNLDAALAINLANTFAIGAFGQQKTHENAPDQGIATSHSHQLAGVGAGIHTRDYTALVGPVNARQTRTVDEFDMFSQTQGPGWGVYARATPKLSEKVGLDARLFASNTTLDGDYNNLRTDIQADAGITYQLTDNISAKLNGQFRFEENDREEFTHKKTYLIPSIGLQARF